MKTREEISLRLNESGWLLKKSKYLRKKANTFMKERERTRAGVPPLRVVEVLGK
jgi:hypothetical protein